MTAKIILVVFGLSLLINNSVGDISYIPCRIGKETAFWLVKLGVKGGKINDNHGEGFVTVLNTTGIKDITVDKSKWLNLTFDKNAQTITVYAKDAFNDNYDQYGEGRKITVNMTVTCEEENEVFNIPYYQEIVDINSHAPKWNQPSYLFESKGTLKKDFDLTNTIEISASDDDFTDVDLSFEISEKDHKQNTQNLELYIDKIEGKTTHVRVQILRDIQPFFEKTYIMSVKDRDTEDAKITQVELTIKLTESDVPFSFAKSTYNYQVNNETLMSDEFIELTESEDHSIELSFEDSEYSKYFSAEMDYLTGHVILGLKESLPVPPQESRSIQDISVKLNAKWQNKITSTEVHIHSDQDLALICFVPGMDITSAIFKNPQKLKDSTDSHKIVYGITGIKNVESMSCKANNYLKCDFNKSQGEFTIKTTKKFEDYEEKERDTSIFLNLTIKCPYDNIKKLVFKQEILDINNNKPKFEEKKYFYSLYNDVTSSFQNLFDIRTLQEIVVTDDDLTSSQCTFRIEDDDDLFTMVDYKTPVVNRKCRASFAPRNNLKAPFDKTFTLVVEDDGVPINSGRTKIRVRLGIDKRNKPQFTSSKYFMKKLKNQTTLIAYEKYATPRLQNGADSDTHFSVTDEKLAVYFNLIFNELTQNLDIYVYNLEDWCKNCQSITVPIKAAWKGLETTAKLTIGLNDRYKPPVSFADDNDVFNVWLAYLSMSLVGMILMFILTTVSVSAMIYLLFKRFILPRSRPQDQPIVFVAPVANLPEKITI